MKSIKYSKLANSFKLACAVILCTQLCSQLSLQAVSWGDIRKQISNPPSLSQVSQGLQTAATTVDKTDAALEHVKMAVLTTLDDIENLAIISKTSGLAIHSNALAIGNAGSAKDVIDPLFGMINAPLTVYDNALTVLIDLTNVLDRLSKNLIQPVDAAAHSKVIALVQDISNVNAKMQDMSRKLHATFPLIQSYAHKLHEHGSNMVRYVKESPLNRR